MPYTKKGDRPTIRQLVHKLSHEIIKKGDLNYAICELVGTLILRTGIGYTNISEWVDGVDGAERELTRRLLNPYEDKKIQENGDVESFELIMQQMFPGDYK
ncbi:MAG: hypothetical protein PVG65_01430 [Candidatus Thorarchaeota archaeon]|jgi:hypothetical protein